MFFKLELTQDEKEAVYSSLCATAEVDPNPQVHTKSLFQFLQDRAANTVELTDTQLFYVLEGMSRAIDHATNRADDWLRAKQYIKAKESIVAKSQAQRFLRVVQ